MNFQYKLLAIALSLFTAIPSFGQGRHLLTIDTLFSLLDSNSKELQLSRQKIQLARVNTDIARQKMLPDLETGFELGYISNAQIWTPHLSFDQTLMMPHVQNNYAVDAGLLVFVGKSVRNNIAKASLEEQLAALDYRKDRDDIQFLIVSKYLELFTLQNQRKVYLENIRLANQRLDNIAQLRKEGMVTGNDLLRSKLQITDLELRLEEINNDIHINSHTINIIVGIPDSSWTDIDSTLYGRSYMAAPYEQYQDNLTATPEGEIARQQAAVAEKDIALARAERSPKISLYASDKLNRPFLYTLQPLDIYWNYIVAGVKLSYNLSSLYTSGKHIQKSKLEYNTALIHTEWVDQQSQIRLTEAYVKLSEAKDRYAKLKESYQLAADNYRVVYQKYQNQMAIMVDLLDASTALLNAQLSLSDAHVNIIYQWYRLQKVSGNWGK